MRKAGLTSSSHKLCRFTHHRNHPFSGKTGAPTALMELAYRFDWGESPYIQKSADGMIR